MSGVYNHSATPLASFGSEKRKRGKRLDNLTIDSIEAERRGVSYGKYKAMSYDPHKEAPKQEPAPAPKTDKTARTCPVCGKTFYTVSHVKIYCSDECRERNGMERRDRKRMEEKRNG